MKAFTDLEQSKKLAEILSLESADMSYRPYREEGGIPDYHLDLCPYVLASWIGVPAWSLAALLEQLDDEITDEDGNDYNLTIVKENLQYQLYYHDSWGEVEDIETDYYDDLVDAAFEMIIRLKENNLL